jgi:hypothetical protein
MKKLIFVILLLILSVPLYAQGSYPDSASLIGYTHTSISALCGSQISVRDSQGWIHVVWAFSWYLSDSSEIFYSHSTDNGTTWSSMVNISQTGIQRAYAPALAIDSQDNLHCTWNQYDEHSESFDVFYSRYDGQSWSQPVNISLHGHQEGFSLLSSLVVDSKDNIHAVWDKSEWGGYDVYYSFYNDTIWSTPLQLSQSESEDKTPALTVDENDNLHVVWAYNGNALLYRRFDGSSWTDADTINTDYFYVGNPCIVTDSQCYPKVCYLGVSADLETCYVFYSECDGSVWSLPFNVSSPLVRAKWVTLAIDSSDNIYTVWSAKSPEKEDIFIRTFDGGVWSNTWFVVEDTLYSQRPKLGNPVKGDKLDLVFMSRFGISNTYEVLYLGLDVLAGIAEQPDQRQKTSDIRLLCHPNPFTSSTTITFHSVSVYRCIGVSEIQIYDISGRKIKNLPVLSSQFPVPSYVWDGRDGEGRVVSPGIYFFTMGGKSVGKVVKVR